MSRLIRALLCTTLSLASVAAGPAPTLPDVPRPPRPGLVTTEGLLEALGGRPCPYGSDFTCVTITVPLDHFSPDDPRTLDVVFAVLPAPADTRQGLFVTASGGPGASGLASADSYTSSMDPRLPRHFDIVFFDQRGVGESGDLTCPDATQAYYAAEFLTFTPAQEAAARQTARTFAEDCAAEIDHPERLPYLGTAQAIEDLERFRQAMRAGQFWLYGESYGTQFAQTYAAAYPEHLAGLILDGTVDMTLEVYDYYFGQARAFAEVLDMTLAACAEDPACAADLGGDPPAVYDRLARRLQRGPLPLRFPLPEGGTAGRELTFTGLETVVGGQVYGELDRMLLTRALAAYARNGDLAPLARLLYLNLGVEAQTLEPLADVTFSEAMYYAVECQDYYLPGNTPDDKAGHYLRAGDAVEAALPHLSSFFYGDLPCAYWPSPPAEAARPAPLAAAGIPTLVLGATADPATPVGNGEAVFARLEDGYLFTQQGGPHVIFGRGNDCPDAAVADFMVDGERPAQRENECVGVVMDEYVPLAPLDAADFANVRAALTSAEDELTFLPEYWYWDGAAPTQAGCPAGGTIDFDMVGDAYGFTLNACAFTAGLSLTGPGSYDYDRDRFTLDVTLSGRWRCSAKYVRTGGNLKLTGSCP